MKISVIFALLVLLVFALVACQATPTQSIVKEKNLDKMIQEATQTQTPAAGGVSASGTGSSSGDSATTGAISETQGKTIAQIIGAQKTYVKELTDAKGKVKIHVNAQVQVPDATGVTVQRVGQSTITQAQVDALVQHMMKGDLFSGNEYKPTKTDIQNQILQVEATISKGIPSNNPKLGKSYFQDILKNLQDELKTAPDQTTKTPCDGKLTPMSPDIGTGEELFALSQSADGMYDSLHVYDFSDDGSSMVDFSSEKNAFSKSQEYFMTKEFVDALPNGGVNGIVTQQELAGIPDIKISKDDARKMADEVVKALGIQNLSCISEDKEYGGSYDKTPDQSTFVNPRKCVWFLRYARSVNNVPVTYTVYDCMKVEENNQAAPWPYEDMTFAVDDSGIVAFSWRSPYQMGDEVTKNSNLLSFDNAMSIFNTMAPVANSWDGMSAGDPPSITGFDINVTRIQFGLTRVTEQNKRNSGLLVPCWDFFANTTYTETVNGQNVTKTYDTGYPMLTVNAIDGSVINRSLGY